MVQEKERGLTLTVEETAELLRISRSSAYEGIASGEIPSVRIGRRILIPRVAIERMLNEAGRKIDN